MSAYNTGTGPPQGETYGQSMQSGPAPTTAGHHKHDILNKLDPRVDSTKDHHSVNVPQGSYGPHSSRNANALDPRMDSDGDRNAGRHAGAGASGVGGATMHGANTRSAMDTSGGAPEGTYGPHSSRAANALDPRVDSDVDGSRNTTGAGYGAGAGRTGGGAPEGTYGPHSSREANALDPRVDSDVDGGRNTTGAGAGYGTGAGRTGGGHQPAYGANSSGANSAISGPGPASKTAGPHKSNLLNKLDPSVDSKAGTAQGATNGGMTGGSGAGAGGYDSSGRY